MWMWYIIFQHLVWLGYIYKNSRLISTGCKRHNAPRNQEMLNLRRSVWKFFGPGLKRGKKYGQIGFHFPKLNRDEHNKIFETTT